MPDEAAVACTDPDHPAGCLIVGAATDCSPQTTDIEETLRARRTADVRLFETRLEEAVARGPLPGDTGTRSLAVCFAAVVQGMSQQARDGATEDRLRRTAEYATAAWPAPSA